MNLVDDLNNSNEMLDECIELLSALYQRYGYDILEDACCVLEDIRDDVQERLEKIRRRKELISDAYTTVLGLDKNDAIHSLLKQMSDDQLDTIIKKNE